jgi:hypothetical protein
MYRTMTTGTLVSIDGVVPVRADLNPQSERLTDLLFGEEFVAISEHEGAIFGTTRVDGVEGFVPSASLACRSTRATHRVRRTIILVYHAPDLLTASGKILPMNALVELTGRSAAVRYPGGSPGSTVVELRTGGWVTEQGLSPIDQFEADLGSVASMFIRAVYLHGGKTWFGCDSSGFIQTVLAARGKRVPRERAHQMRLFEREHIALGSPSPTVGHSVVYSDASCGFLLGNDVVAARTETMLVDVTPLEEFSRRSETPVRIIPISFEA